MNNFPEQVRQAVMASHCRWRLFPGQQLDHEVLLGLAGIPGGDHNNDTSHRKLDLAHGDCVPSSF